MKNIRRFLAKTKYFGVKHLIGFHYRDINGNEVVRTSNFQIIMRKGWRFFVLGSYHHEDDYRASLKYWRDFAAESWSNYFS